MTNDPNTLSSLSSCYRCLSDFHLLAAKTSLLCSIKNSNFTPVSPTDPVVLQLLANIATLQASFAPNLPSLPPSYVTALDTFVKGLRSDGVWNNLIEVNCFLFVTGGVDNIGLAALPLILGPLGAPINGLRWSPLGLDNTNCSINGVQPIPANSSQMLTNMIPNGTFKAVGNAGISMYVSSITSSANCIETGSFSPDNANCILLYSNSFTNHAAAGCWNAAGTDGPSAAAPNLNGFYSFSRIGNNTAYYFGNSTNAFSQLASNNILTGTIFDTNAIAVFCCVANSGVRFDFSDKRISFIAYHDGLTSTQSQALFNRVQALRTALGGGFA